jgi:hypothetical protein
MLAMTSSRLRGMMATTLMYFEVEVVEVVEDRKVRVFICDNPGMCERTDPGAHLRSLLVHMEFQASRGFQSKVGPATY